MYTDVLIGLILGLLILVAREVINYKRNKEASIAIANYKERGREIATLTIALKEANDTIAELTEKLED